MGVLRTGTRPSWESDYRSAYNKQYRAAHPDVCRRAWDNPEAKARRHLLSVRFSANLRLWKSAQGCKECGQKNPLLLEYHHRDGGRIDRARCICNMKTASLERLLDEIALCDVLCVSCHRTLAVQS